MYKPLIQLVQLLTPPCIYLLITLHTAALDRVISLCVIALSAPDRHFLLQLPVITSQLSDWPVSDRLRPWCSFPLSHVCGRNQNLLVGTRKSCAVQLTLLVLQMQRTVVVAGGGISGLTACYHLVKDAKVSKVILLESSSRMGGWMHSTRTEDGAVFEHGPRSMRPAGVVGKNSLCMVSELGLEGDLLPIPRSHPAVKNRFLYVNKSLHKLPSSLGGVLRTIPPFTRPLFLCGLRDLTAPRGSQEDECVHDFFTRRFGKELADIVVDSLCRGVFAGDCRKLSLRSCFPFLHDAEVRKRSVVLGMVTGGEKAPKIDSPLIQRAKKERWSQWSLRRGMQTLSEALEDYIRQRGVEIHKDTPVEALERTSNGWKVSLPNGSVTADHIFSAIPAAALSRLLDPVAKPMADTLRQLNAANVAVVNLEYDGEVLPVSGFGHLIPSFEDSTVLGIVYDSLTYPQHNRQGLASTRLTVMMGGAWFESSLGDPDSVSAEKVLSLATEAAATQLGVTSSPSRAIVSVNKACIPQYTLGHWKHIENLSSYIRQQALPISLIGASYEGVSVNDCIYNAKRSVQSFAGC
ncbi:protoporphyrinogen oxidase [Hyperolius riggenbachi]|uniref:protoporphyrinogen oxidase n=1 Tax=Hyperolius riggenbachi TaxID=752182 RepID=UPI0035A33B44